MTSIEMIEEQLKFTHKETYNDLYEVIEQAKEMHKQEIIDAAERWKGTDFAERYYQETFKKD